MRSISTDVDILIVAYRDEFQQAKSAETVLHRLTGIKKITKKRESVLQRVLLIACIAWIFAGSQVLLCETDPSKGTKAELPDAPQPAVAEPTQDVPVAGVPLSGPMAGAVVYAPLYARTIFPGETARRLNAKQKFFYSARQMVEPVNLLPALASSGWSQYMQSDPLYGDNFYAFWQRFGAATAREDSDRLFTDGVLPIVLREDVRYYRLGERASNVRRVEYALGQVFVARNDYGKEVPNYSGFIGRAMAIGLTFAYYPPASRTAGVALSGFGSSVGGLAAYDLLREFLPREVFSHLTIFREPDVTVEPAK